MTDWTVTAAGLATAAGTLVRSAQRAARATEAALLAGIRPVLVTSQLEDASQKVHFQDDHWVRVEGGRAVVEITDEAIYMLVSLRNAGSGLAVLDRWELMPGRVLSERSAKDVTSFRRLTRDIYVPAGDLGFWQGALRDPDEPLFDAIRVAVKESQPLTLDILYGDHLGGQRTISRFLLNAMHDGQWIATIGRHWNLDQPDPR
jgi:hypothetical protein